MSTPLRSVVAALLLVTAAPHNASAQEDGVSLESVLSPYLAREVRVSDVQGMSLDGAIASIHDGQLDMLTRGGTRTLPLESIARVERHGDSVKNGFIAGAVVGGLMGLLVSAGCDDVGMCLYFTAVSATMYGLVGAGIDALYSGWTPLYVRVGKRAHAGFGKGHPLVTMRFRF